MRVEGGLVEGNGAADVDRSGGGPSFSKKKNNRPQKKPMPGVVQRLYDVCSEVFAHGQPMIVPSPEDVDRIRAVLDEMNPIDLNVSKKMRCLKNPKVIKGKKPVTYLHLYECDKFSIGIFCLPSSSVIPLHNHPGMTVFSKLLFGTMHIKSYDWAEIPDEGNGSINPTHSGPPEVRLAKMKTDAFFTAPCDTSILYPASGGNMHCFTAKTSCIVLDVLGPPYSDPDGRHCQYYNSYPYAKFSGDMGGVPTDGEYAWLEARDKPDDFYVVGAEYTGPRIVVN